MRATPETTLFCGGNCQPTDAARGCADTCGGKCGLCPLAGFYTAAARPLPGIREIAAAEMPDPYRRLLVHDRDMTTTLEAFHGVRTHLRLLTSKAEGGVYRREVVLALAGFEKPVEFGAVTIQIELLPPDARQAVINAQRPLGGVLVGHGVKFTSRPKAFISIEPDETICKVLEIERRSTTLYGRCNALLDAQGRVLADIVEILPPMDVAA
jgi:chorismate-pyruvate lyase